MKACLHQVAAACMLVLALAICTPAHAFNSLRWYPSPGPEDLLSPHNLITREPLESMGYRCDAVTRVMLANLMVDSPPMKDVLVRHFNREPLGAVTDFELADASTTCLQITSGIIQTQLATIEQFAESDRRSALDSLGTALHTIQDFYSHSNWYKMSGAELLRVEEDFLYGRAPYTGSGLLLAAYSGGIAGAGACDVDRYAHGPLCPVGYYGGLSCAHNNDCSAASEYAGSRDMAREATRVFLRRVERRIRAHVGYRKSADEVYAALLEYGCDGTSDEGSGEGEGDEDGVSGEVVTSLDPNEIVGPAGGGSRRATSPDRAWRYEIHFENLPTAGASANEVEVRNPIDLDAFDPATVSVHSMTVGERTILIQRPIFAVDTLLDLRPARPCLVHVKGGIVASGDTLVWTFDSIDPATGLAPEDPGAGFLAPNRFSPEGEGSVTYTIQPRAGIVDGTVVANGASIVFDRQTALATGEWKNLVDRTEPVLTTLKAEARFDSTVLLRWSGTDQTSGVWCCDLYVVGVNGVPQLAAAGVVVDSVRLGIRPGSDTGFLAIVRDSAGNRRAMPATPDAVLEWMPPPKALNGITELFTYPSPAKLSFSVRFRLGERSEVDLGLFDVAGRRVWSQSGAQAEPGPKVYAVAPGPSVHPGVYWLRVSTSQGRMQNRIVLLK